MAKGICLFIALAALCVSSTFAYAPIGHEIVGAIADKLLADKPAHAKIDKLIDGISLERASVMADEIKSWDKRGADDPASFHYLAHPKIDNELRDFWRANPPTIDPSSAVPSHHWFHYTDVPIFELEKYSDGKVGRTQWDIVHMISYCVGVLKGDIPADNPRKITKAVAIILLAHYVGDIHQPLHVGAEYFDAKGRAINPDKGGDALVDEGGNSITLVLRDQGAGNGQKPLKFHGFWDLDTVMANFPPVPETLSKEERRNAIEPVKRKLIDELASEQPKNWRLSASIALKDYAENWANEILPIAREAHERLRFKNVAPFQDENGRTIAAGEADEEQSGDKPAYRDWAGKVVRDELQRAGWRLADLLEQAVQ